MIILLILFLICTEIMVLSCCIIAGNDPLSRMISDFEQLMFIKQWNIDHPKAEKDRFV